MRLNRAVTIYPDQQSTQSSSGIRACQELMVLSLCDAGDASKLLSAVMVGENGQVRKVENTECA
jgi:hypothetical protein